MKEGSADTSGSDSAASKAAKSGTEALLDILEEISAGEPEGVARYLMKLHASDLIDIRA